MEQHIEDNNQYYKHADNIKTINEFLIDLIGVLVPGGLFLFSIIISFIIPVIMIYFHDITKNSTKMSLLDSNVFTGWFWMVLFFMFLILSYAIGNIFYRLDIKDVDRLSFIRQRKKIYKDKIEPFIDKKKYHFKKKFHFKKIEDDKLEDFIKEYFGLLLYHWKEDGRFLDRDKQIWIEKFEELRKKEIEDKKIIIILNKIASLLYEKKFPEALILLDNGSLSNPINNSSDKVKYFLTPFIKPEKENYSEFLALSWYFLFCLRSEVACDNEEECQFPYEHYDTYLSKRGELNLIKFVTWCENKDSRTKNAINTLKLKIQLKSKEAYNILVKNEAHIRMASSSYRVADMICSVLSVAIILIIIVLLVLFFFEKKFSIAMSIEYVIVILSMPVSVLLLNRFIKKSVIEFLHYQRLREIFFVIQVYDEIQIK